MTRYGEAMGRVVVFDLGNVLIDWDPLPAIAAGVGEGRARAFLDSGVFEPWNHARDEGSSWEEGLTWLAEHEPRWVEAGRAYVEHFDRSLRGPVVGSVVVLRRLHGAQVPVCAMTNWSSELFPVAIERFGFLRLFEHVVVSGTVGVAKPNPAIYAHAEGLIGREPEQIVFVDDKPANVEAAVARGWDGIRFAGPARLEAELAERDLL